MFHLKNQGYSCNIQIRALRKIGNLDKSINEGNCSTNSSYGPCSPLMTSRGLPSNELQGKLFLDQARVVAKGLKVQEPLHLFVGKIVTDFIFEVVLQ